MVRNDPAPNHFRTSESEVRRVTVGELRATQTARINRFCVVPLWLHHWSIIASRLLHSRLMQHLPKLREPLFLLLQPELQKQTLRLTPTLLPRAPRCLRSLQRQIGRASCRDGGWMSADAVV